MSACSRCRSEILTVANVEDLMSVEMSGVGLRPAEAVGGGMLPRWGDEALLRAF